VIQYALLDINLKGDSPSQELNARLAEKGEGAVIVSTAAYVDVLSHSADPHLVVTVEYVAENV
jgi:dihydroxyacetone kinase-like predicted kinase